MTIYEKELAELVNRRFDGMKGSQLLRKLIEMGVIDTTRCKILAVREFVNERVKNDSKKVDAMWTAAEKFSCSYEYIRKCMYYYRDVNVS